ncbi:unnamed protein product [Rotaria sordida]|uniref:Uncharacterized protein n=1 Tax=Rotaria sordida TaxID=392033 RepID=A0A815B900_9BILA|nr:unnamed protein product [Rotaria sordida]CAF1273340.1 unnamed protein product [Rotaria sordida]CAF1337389.1 unnamed protein product [Rotaria sordida]CAF1544287.1 unnamed protein product [Rotaria sordida]CAF4007594.1 unnamed protein product [Rotaria sordida]
MKQIREQAKKIRHTVDFTEEIEKTIQREHSFIGWPHRSPSQFKIINGGWCLNTIKGTDYTICLYCVVEHNNWNYDDNPWNVHQELSPDCPFLLPSHPMHSSSVPTKDLDGIFTQEKIDSDVTQHNPTMILPSNSHYCLPPH